MAFASSGESFGKLEKPLAIDPYDAKQFAVSDVALSKEIRKVTETDASLDALLLEGRTPLIASGMQITPTGNDRFKKTDLAACYMEIYEPLNLGEKVAPVGVELQIFDRKTGEAKGNSGMIEMTNQSKQGNPVVPIALRLPVNQLAPGSYKAELTAKDGAGKSATRAVNFEVVE